MQQLGMEASRTMSSFNSVNHGRKSMEKQNGFTLSNGKDQNLGSENSFINRTSSNRSIMMRGNDAWMYSSEDMAASAHSYGHDLGCITQELRPSTQELRSGTQELRSYTQESVSKMHDLGSIAHDLGSNMTLVLPMGEHGLPSNGGKGPSSLIERWRSDGRSCECGGWDLGCGLKVSSTHLPNPEQSSKDAPYHVQPVSIFSHVSEPNLSYIHK